MPLPGLFEADNDVDLAYSLAPEMAGAQDGPEHNVLCSFGNTRLPGDRDNIIDNSSADGRSALERLRQRLDAGLGDVLIEKYRTLADAPNNASDKHEAQYKFIILGALMMGTGAKIKDDDLQQLRQLASTVQSNETFTFPMSDTGFRGPSKRQFLAAVDNYQPGTPRDFNQPSCQACGKTRQDTAKALLRCSGCTTAWFCDKVGLKTSVGGSCH